VPSRRAPVRLDDVASFAGVFLSNARGVAAVSQVDDVRLPLPTDRLAALVDAYAAVPWDPI
jgi:hypothetical protein